MNASSTPALRVAGLRHSYRIGGRATPVLHGLDFTISRGEFVAVQGPSGSGKSTLFYLMGGLLRADEGEIWIDGEAFHGRNRDELAILRNRKIGFVFQQFHLLPGANVLENILLAAKYPLETAHVGEVDVARAKRLAERLGIAEQLHQMPNQLSGGQMQRVAIARALMNDVPLLLADEPTGALDSKTAADTLELFRELNREGRTVLLITHDNEVAAQCGRVLRIRDGRLLEEDSPHARNDEGAATSSSAEPRRRERAQPVQPPEAEAIPSGPKGAIKSSVKKQAAALSHGTWRLGLGVLPEAVANIRRNKLKSLLTMLGVVIGISAVLAMTTLGTYVKKRLLESYEALGVNKLGLGGYRNWRLKASDNVTTSFESFDPERDVARLPEVFPDVELISPILNMNRMPTLLYGGNSLSDKVRVFGVNESYFEITNLSVGQGRPFNAFHIQNRSPVCIVGADIVERLFGGRNPVGEFMTVNMSDDMVFPCRVWGALAPKMVNDDWQNPGWHVYMPWTYLYVMSPRINDLTARARSGTDISELSDAIKAYYEHKYGMAGQFWVNSDATLVDQTKRFMNLFTILLGAIASLSLLVGGIGINNMMLVSIAERLREFGLRKALGATDRSLRYQVLAESLCLCVVAGLIGLVIGFGAYEALIYGASKFSDKIEFRWVIEPWSVLLSSVAIVSVGILSGFVPAMRAEKLQVMEALRSE